MKFLIIELYKVWEVDFSRFYDEVTVTNARDCYETNTFTKQHFGCSSESSASDLFFAITEWFSELDENQDDGIIVELYPMQIVLTAAEIRKADIRFELQEEYDDDEEILFITVVEDGIKWLDELGGHWDDPETFPDSIEEWEALEEIDYLIFHKIGYIR